MLRHTANLLSASRFVLAALWLIGFDAGGQRPAITAPIALAGAVSDFLDGRVARWTGSATGFGQWLDSLADIAFVLTAIACEARAGAIPAYIPVLIAVSFTQYAIDSVVLRGSSVPVRSRVGHWGGILNYTIVVVLGLLRRRDGSGRWFARPRRSSRFFTLPQFSRGCWRTRAAGDRAPGAKGGGRIR